MSFKWLLKLVVKLFAPFIPMLTGNIKDELDSFIKDLYKKAEATNNVIDDFVIKMIADILNIDVD